MFSLDVVLPSASLAAEAVLQAGLDLDTAEVPQILRTELLLVTQVREGLKKIYIKKWTSAKSGPLVFFFTMKKTYVKKDVYKEQR